MSISTRHPAAAIVLFIGGLLCIGSLVHATPAPTAKEAAPSQAQQQPKEQRQRASERQRQQQAKQALLKRIYEARMRLDRDRANNDIAARNNVQLIRQNTNLTADAPTVRQMRQETAAQLARFEQSLRCLDVDVESNGGNTVVICGGNSGDISGENVSAGRDIIAPVPVPVPVPVPGP